jgi:hypothetical protein
MSRYGNGTSLLPEKGLSDVNPYVPVSFLADFGSLCFLYRLRTKVACSRTADAVVACLRLTERYDTLGTHSVRWTVRRTEASDAARIRPVLQVIRMTGCLHDVEPRR